jgi:hypothetical protein
MLLHYCNLVRLGFSRARKIQKPPIRHQPASRVNKRWRTGHFPKESPMTKKLSLSVAVACIAGVLSLPLLSAEQRPASGDNAASPSKPAAVDPKAHAEHEAMAKQHEQAEEDHAKWSKEIADWQADHSEALATLARAQAVILHHQAELDRFNSRIAAHELAMRAHDKEIKSHEGGGDAKLHEKFVASHMAMEEMHEKMAKTVGHASDQHKQLMQKIAELRAMLDALKPE